MNTPDKAHSASLSPCALALFSGGLDSILACRVIADQGIKVRAVKYISPFFDYNLLGREERYIYYIKEKFNIDVMVRDISKPYIEMLANPPHGYGKNFNPCIDCKIMMIKETMAIMDEFNASFIISGEVIGQRPMSQRKDTLRVIERDSESDGILLRPLCAGSQKPTRAELDGIVNRDLLPSFSGRTRQPQIKLAAEFGIKDFPGPAGGCVLTDPILSQRIKSLYQEQENPGQIKPADIAFLLTGRQFRLRNGAWFTVGRRKQENEIISGLLQEGDFQLKIANRPGPTGLLRYAHHQQDIEDAASIVARFGKKTANGPAGTMVNVSSGDHSRLIAAHIIDDQDLNHWQR